MSSAEIEKWEHMRGSSENFYEIGNARNNESVFPHRREKSLNW